MNALINHPGWGSIWLHEVRFNPGTKEYPRGTISGWTSTHYDNYNLPCGGMDQKEPMWFPITCIRKLIE